MEARGASSDEPRLTYLVKQLQEALLDQLDGITQPFGLTPRQYTTLSVLARHRGMSSAALGRLTFVTPQAAHEMVATLERKGFLERFVDEDNRRQLEVELTRAGTRTLARCDELIDRLEADVFSSLGTAERERFRRALATCTAATQRSGVPVRR